MKQTSHKKHREEVRRDRKWNTGPAKKKCPICNAPKEEPKKEGESK